MEQLNAAFDEAYDRIEDWRRERLQLHKHLVKYFEEGDMQHGERLTQWLDKTTTPGAAPVQLLLEDIQKNVMKMLAAESSKASDHVTHREKELEQMLIEAKLELAETKSTNGELVQSKNALEKKKQIGTYSDKDVEKLKDAYTASELRNLKNDQEIQHWKEKAQSLEKTLTEDMTSFKRTTKLERLRLLQENRSLSERLQQAELRRASSLASSELPKRSSPRHKISDLNTRKSSSPKSLTASGNISPSRKSAWSLANDTANLPTEEEEGSEEESDFEEDEDDDSDEDSNT